MERAMINASASSSSNGSSLAESAPSEEGGEQLFSEDKIFKIMQQVEQKHDEESQLSSSSGNHGSSPSSNNFLKKQLEINLKQIPEGQYERASSMKTKESTKLGAPLAQQASSRGVVMRVACSPNPVFQAKLDDFLLKDGESSSVGVKESQFRAAKDISLSEASSLSEEQAQSHQLILSPSVCDVPRTANIQTTQHSNFRIERVNCISPTTNLSFDFNVPMADSSGDSTPSPELVVQPAGVQERLQQSWRELKQSLGEFLTSSVENDQEQPVLSTSQSLQFKKRRQEYVRMWVMNCLFWNLLTILTEKYQVNPYFKAFNWGLDVTILWCIVLSYISESHINQFRDWAFDPINVSMVLQEVLAAFAMFKTLGIVQQEKPMHLTVVTGTVVSGNIFNFVILGHLFPRHRTLMIAAITIIVMTGIILRGFGLDHLKANMPFVIQIGIIGSIYFIMFFFVNNSMILLNQEETNATSKSLQQLQTEKKAHEEQQLILESLDLGLVETKQDQTSFTNSIFKQLLFRLGINLEARPDFEFLDLQLVRVFRAGSSNPGSDTTSKLLSQYSSLPDLEVGTLLSLRQIFKLPQVALNGKIFEFVPSPEARHHVPNPNFQIGEGNQYFKQVQLKLSKGKKENKRQLLQIIDVSDKMLYGEAKAEQQFLSLINAAVSHELRNPLNSLTGQVVSMKGLFEDFETIILCLQSFVRSQSECFGDHKAHVERLAGYFEAVYKGLSECSKKMYSAVNFVDYFVHDILDYTMLMKDKNFTKNKMVFDVKEAINEIKMFLEDKARLKEIDIGIELRGFQEEEVMVKQADGQKARVTKTIRYVLTDRKRMQQILLNLVSNALKFTDRGGKILVLVQKKDAYLQISVIDSGLGIKKENQKKLFQLFGSIKDEKKKINTEGIGLGLVISKMIANKFGGEIDFVSKFKKGSTFFFTFEIESFDYRKFKSEERQRKEEQQRKLEEKTKLVDINRDEILLNDRMGNLQSQTAEVNVLALLKTALRFRQSRILVADDEEFCLASMKAIMARAGVDVQHQVDFCISGEEALSNVNSLAEVGQAYRMIFTDFNMPAMDGIEASKQIRLSVKNFPQLYPDERPVIIGLTGHVNTKFTRLGIKAGMTEVLPKPLYVDALCQLMEKYGII